jgi:hypothetical protein
VEGFAAEGSLDFAIARGRSVGFDIVSVEDSRRGMKDGKARSGGGRGVCSIRWLLFWWLVGYTSCTLYYLLVITFGGLHLLKRCEPWLEGFRVSLVCSCRLHVCMQKM